MVSAPPAGAAGAPAGDFVEVHGPRFFLHGTPHHFAGANCYYLMIFAADPELRPYVDEVLGEAAGRGLGVIRTWAFNDGDGPSALQTAPGVYDETVFQGLDYVLDRCRTLGLRVILPLVNSWVDYGGMDRYVAWSPTASSHDDFYRDAACRSYYLNHAAAVIGRTNSVNGVTYRDDPTILAWELANEPRCASDPSGDTLAGWIADMSAAIHGLDPNHLVATGIEGFYDDGAGPWYLDGSQGVDFLRDHAPPGIDFAVAHSWPDDWELPFAATMGLVSRQIADACAVIGKPFVLEEYGTLRDGAGASSLPHYDPRTWFPPGSPVRPVPGAAPVLVDPARAAVGYADPSAPVARGATTRRDRYFGAWGDSLVAHRCGGSVYWAAYHDAYPDYDGYGVYDPADESTLTVLGTHAAAMHALEDSADAPCDETIPAVARLGAPRPNPAHGEMEIPVLGMGDVAARIRIVDPAGRMVRTLVVAAGTTAASWDGRDALGRRVGAGVYFAVLDAAGGRSTTSLVLLP